MVLLVTLGFTNAYNSAQWVDMLWALVHKFHVPVYLLGMINWYLSMLCCTTHSRAEAELVTSGGPQGSILGPDLWNFTYDSLMRLYMPKETSLVSYFDDVTALILARSVELTQITVDLVMRLFNGCIH